MALNLLLVDDDYQQRKIVQDALDLFSKTCSVQIDIDEANNSAIGLQKLKMNQYDGAIVDLRLDTNQEDATGNLIIKEIKENLRFPIRIISGHLGDLDDELLEKSFFYDYYSRDEVDYDIIFNQLVDIYATGITQILNNKGRINTDITKIFWRHISTILPHFISEKKTKADWDTEKVLLRYISSHILEYLELSIDNNLEPVHNIEFYIKPSIKEKIFTGDIVRKKESKDYWVVLTPVCDLATDEKRKIPKAEYITLVAIENTDSVITGKNSGDVKKLHSNNMDLKYHYLPKSILFEGGFINFQHINCVLTSSILKHFDIELVIANSFRKDIVSRFSNYYSRQGQPTFN